MENSSRALRWENKNPSGYYVSALYSDGFHFQQNKNKFISLLLFISQFDFVFLSSKILLVFPPPTWAGTHKRIGTKIKHYTRYSQNHDISAPKGCYIQLEKKTAKYILDNIQSSYLFALPNHLDYFEYEELKIVRIYYFLALSD